MAFHHLHPSCHIDWGSALTSNLDSLSGKATTWHGHNGVSACFEAPCSAYAPIPVVVHRLKSFTFHCNVVADDDWVHYDHNLDDDELGGEVHHQFTPCIPSSTSTLEYGILGPT